MPPTRSRSRSATSTHPPSRLRRSGVTRHLPTRRKCEGGPRAGAATSLRI